MAIFRNDKEAQTIVEAFRQEYNNYRPHSSLGYLTPAEFARRYYERHKEEQAIQPWARSISRRAYVAIRREWEIGAKRYTYWATSGDDAWSL